MSSTAKKHAAEIKKIFYKTEIFDASIMKVSHREIVSVSADGSIVIKSYKGTSKKPYSVCTERCSPEKFAEVCEQIEDCIENADRLVRCIDDSSKRLKICYGFGHYTVADSRLGNSKTNIGRIMWDFLEI